MIEYSAVALSKRKAIKRDVKAKYGQSVAQANKCSKIVDKLPYM